jgi:ribonuclease VapC
VTSLARVAYRTYGKGNHPAGLNFGDCFSFALAKATNEPLLFKGDDFAQTDIERVGFDRGDEVSDAKRPDL